MCQPHPPGDPRLVSHLLHSARSGTATAALRWTGDGVVVELCGELDLTCLDQLAHVSDVLAGWSHRPVVDASGVTFVDVSGLRALLGLAPPGGSLLVLEPSRPLLRVVDLLRRATAWPPLLAVGPPEQALVLRRPALEPASPAPASSAPAGPAPAVPEVGSAAPWAALPLPRNR